jgi:sugar phosphate isomerase/epimerase
MKITRRTMLQATGVATGWWAASSLQQHLSAQPTSQPTTQPQFSTARYKIAVCDWMLLKRQKLGAIQWAKRCGMDGVEVDMGGIGNRPLPDNKLRDPAVRQQYLDESKKLGVEICSIALSGFYAGSWPKNPNGDAITEDWIETMRLMGVKAGFLPLLGGGDVAKDEENRKLAIERFKRMAPKAEQAGVIMGIETMLDVEQSKRFLDDVGSPSVRLYYNLGLGIERGGDIYQEIRQLGKDRICMIHAKEEDGHWLGEPGGHIDLAKLKSALDDIDWIGWLVVERSRHDPKKIEENYSTNARNMKAVFQS